jgi:hypothetical protein
VLRISFVTTGKIGKIDLFTALVGKCRLTSG